MFSICNLLSVSFTSVYASACVSVVCQLVRQLAEEILRYLSAVMRVAVISGYNIITHILDALIHKCFSKYTYGVSTTIPTTIVSSFICNASP